MARSRRRLKRLEVKTGYHHAALEEAWTREAMTHLTDEELRLLRNALRREEHLEGVGFPQLELNPEEQAALDRFRSFYEEVQHGR